MCHFRSLFGVGLILAVGSASIADDGTRPESITDKNGRLIHPLVFKDVQGGFAGFTGKLYRIEPDGKWRVNRVFNRKLDQLKTGRLSTDQLKTLVASLKKNRLLRLPKESGSRAQANPHVITITFGKKKSIIAVRGGLDQTKDLPKGARYDAARKAFAIRDTIRALIKPASGKSDS